MKTNTFKYIIAFCLGISLPIHTAQANDPNLARDCLVTCSSGANPEFAVDGNRDGWFWEASLQPSPCWLEIDLGQIKEIEGINVFMWWGGDKRYYQYFIEVSVDRKKWSEVVDARANISPASAEGSLYKIPLTKARFIRLIIIYNNVNPAAHVREIEIYGN